MDCILLVFSSGDKYNVELITQCFLDHNRGLCFAHFNFKVPSVVRWCTVDLLCLPTMTLVGRHVLANIENKLLECSVQESVFPYSPCYAVNVYVICRAYYLSVMIQLVSFPLSQYDLQLYALELFGQEWLDAPTKGRRSVLSGSKLLQLGESSLENA